MGCTGSRSSSSAIVGAPSSPPDVLGGSGRGKQPLTKSQISQRIEAPKAELQHTHQHVLRLRYAFVSQRGYYPDAPDKDNQDSFSVLPKFGPQQDMCFFGVYDGHGRDGHLCARFARDVLPIKLLARLEAVERLPPNTSSQVFSVEMKKALTYAHLETNDELKRSPNIESQLSGTTAISVFLRDKVIWISNVGDSRAVIVSEQADGRLSAKSLSSDQTPYRRDERERVKKYGARVLTMDQIEGNEAEHENWGDLELGEDIDEGGDPPRIWHPTEDYPGTAFSRSIGDGVAETLGVIAEPEILERELHENDRFILIASDGVFEFLTNQMVADIVTRAPDMLSACQMVVAEAYEMWLQYEVRTDDITIIAIALEDCEGGSRMSRAGSVSDGLGNDVELELLETKPVRREISKEKKKNMIQTKSEEDEAEEHNIDMVSLFVEKSEEDTVSIAGAIKNNFLFQHLNTAQRNAVIGVMQPVQVTPGEWVITQGDQGDRFYVVDSGRYEVRVRGPAPNGGQPDPSGGAVVHIYESGPDQHPGFGELSLMYGKPRAASVIALTEGKLWALDRRIFKNVVMRSMDVRKDTIRCLRKVDLFKCLNLQRLQRLADLLCEEHYAADTCILKQGDVSENFYLIISGHCDCMVETSPSTATTSASAATSSAINSPEETTQSKTSPQTADSPALSSLGGAIEQQYEANDNFNATALLEPHPATFSVIARAQTKVCYIGKTAFEEVFGPLKALLEEDRARNEELKKAVIEAPKTFGDVQLSGLVSEDNVGPLLLGCFGSNTPNVSVRTFLLGEVDTLSLSGSVLMSIEAARTVSSSLTRCPFVPRLLSIYRQPNAFHLLFESPVVSDLYSALQKRDSHTLNLQAVQYVGACIVSALEALHSIGIVYRAVQPEGIFVDSSGRINLIDYRVCKVGGVGARTFTICGAADYLAPEQISSKGHSAPVDLWAMGVLLYELALGSHPFSAASEVATYSKISSFGSPSFPTLTYPETTDLTPAALQELKSIVNKLLVPAPEARLGAGQNGFATLKNHQFFSGLDWHKLSTHTSPLLASSSEECSAIVRDGLTHRAELLESFVKPYQPSPPQQGWASTVTGLVT